MAQMNNSNHDNLAQYFDQISIKIASPDNIRKWSYGEVEKSETINYRTFKPENGGLFCAKIFGPVKDYECLCGRYKRIKYRGIVCEKCGVEVTSASVRRERMGHIDLAVPIVHIWFLKSLPSRISVLLDINLRDVERILYFEAYVVIDPGISDLQQGQILLDEELSEAQDKYGESSFTVSIGAEAIHALLSDLDFPILMEELKTNLSDATSESKKKKLLKRMKLVDDFMESGNRPEWMVIKVLPIIPPDIRPLVMLDGGRFATSDLNELYRRVINRNNRLKRLLELEAPDIIVRNEKRMLQEAVDALFDNGKRGRVVKTSNKRPFKSLSDMLKGKQGRFRQNLLGKRVDYSGRSVIVVGPQLKLYQCGLPKRMALELFKPFVYAKLELYGIAPTIKAAKKMVETEKPEVWDVLESVIRQHPVLLNRAPTLHRLGIQAFEPKLIEGKAIQLHPLVCSAFNADFDGDQMAVHVPLSIESQLECRVLMMSTNNILSPANGKPIIVPDKDIVLGLYYLTSEDKSDSKKQPLLISSISEMHYALMNDIITIHSPVRYRVQMPNLDAEYNSTVVNTTAGRMMLAEILPKHDKLHFGTVNKVINKKNVVQLMDLVYRYCGTKATVIFADHLMELGFRYACKSGISIGMDDMVIPESKQQHVETTKIEVKDYEQQYSDGLITYGEKYNKVIDAWSHCTDRITQDLMKDIAKDKVHNKSVVTSNAIYEMSDSGARGSAAQIKQISGMRGLMAKPSGEIIESPIIANFKEGLSVLEYFNSTHGARKGLADTALKTANSGYLTRRLVDVALDCKISDHDCGTTEGIMISSIMESGEVIVPISERILGRVAAIDITDPRNNKIVINRGKVIEESDIHDVQVLGIDSIKVRSVLKCESKNSVCAKCYGRDLATGMLVAVGEAIGVIAAQSIGEPGTQLTMRTFHIGGAAMSRAEVSSIEVNMDSKLKFIDLNCVSNSDGDMIVMSRICEAVLLDQNDQEKVRYKIPYGSKIFRKDGDMISKGDKIAEWDPYNINIITEKSGKVVYKDIIDGFTMKDITDESTGISNKIIIYARHGSGAELKPRMDLVGSDGGNVKLANGLDAKYYLGTNTVLLVEDGVEVKAGDILAKIPKESTKTKDITGGLPRVVEIVEARNPKDPAIIAYNTGRIEFAKDYKTKRRVILHSTETEEVWEYMIPKGKHILVGDGEIVKKGDVLVDGNLVLQDILHILGIDKLTHYMVNEIQSVYRLQGVKIDDKHIEVIIKQMLRKSQITDPGDSPFLLGDKIENSTLIHTNIQLESQGLKPAKGMMILQGITKSSLQTESFISAASFQETTRVLTDAAVAGKKDKLKGLKENVIVGRLIPAGTGYYTDQYRELAQEKIKQNLV